MLWTRSWNWKTEKQMKLKTFGSHMNKKLWMIIQKTDKCLVELSTACRTHIIMYHATRNILFENDDVNKITIAGTWMDTGDEIQTATRSVNVFQMKFTRTKKMNFLFLCLSHPVGQSKRILTSKAMHHKNHTEEKLTKTSFFYYDDPVKASLQNDFTRPLNH